jgi:hypothetical protein
MEPSPFVKPLPSRAGDRKSPVADLLVLAAVCGALYLIRPLAAAVVGSIGLLLWGASRLSPKVDQVLQRVSARLSAALGEGILHLTLFPLYLLVFPVMRLLLGKGQLLDLRREDPIQVTNWTPVPSAEERHRHLHRPFTKEARAAGGRRFFPLVVRTAAVAVVLLAIAEVALRWRGFGTPVVYEEHPQMGYFPSPHQEIRRRGSDIRINSAGMRSTHDPSRPAESGTYRLLMIGDSTLYGGSYVDQQDLYASRFEELVNREPARYLPKGFQRLEVLPMGVNAWGPHHMLGYLQVFGTFQSHELWVMGAAVDVERPLYGLEALPFFSSKHKPWCALEEALHHGLWRFSGRRRAANEPAPGDQIPKGIQAYNDILELAGRSGLSVRIFFLPTQEENQNRRLQLDPRLRKAVGIHLETAFLDGDGKELYLDGSHLNRDGHAVYAKVLSSLLERRVKNDGGR